MSLIAGQAGNTRLAGAVFTLDFQRAVDKRQMSHRCLARTFGIARQNRLQQCPMLIGKLGE